MATSPIPPPQPQQAAGGPGPGGGFPSPAPGVEDTGAAQLLKLGLQIVASARMIAQKVPGVASEVRQINDLVSQIQAKIISSQQPPETQAPPL